MRAYFAKFWPMTDFLLPAFIALASLYIVVNILLAIGVLKGARCRATATPFVSVIVAARNEEAHIGELVEHLRKQDYRHYEVIIVDDRSTDQTGHLLKTAAHNFSRLRIISVTEPSTMMPAKKHALECGIRASNGEILLFTDADCLPPERWISSVVRCFGESTGLVAGYSPFRENLKARIGGVLFGFIRYEELRAAIWTAGSIWWRLGWLCTGRNLAYRRSVWDEVGGFEQIKHSISGDDDLFLQLVRRTTAWKIRYVSTNDSHMPSAPPSSFGDFVNQRTRHFSAGKFFTFPMKAFFSAYHGANLLLYAGLVVGLFTENPLLVGAFEAKLAADFFLMGAGLKIDNSPVQFLASPLMEFLYLCYNLAMGPLGMRGSFRWKT